MSKQKLIAALALTLACGPAPEIEQSDTSETSSGTGEEGVSSEGGTEGTETGPDAATPTQVLDAHGEYVGTLIEADGDAWRIEGEDGWVFELNAQTGEAGGTTAVEAIDYAPHNCSGPAWLPTPCEQSAYTGHPALIEHMGSLWAIVDNAPTEGATESRLHADGTCEPVTVEGCHVRADFYRSIPVPGPLQLVD